MLTGTLTRNAQTVCNDLIELFECNFSFEDIVAPLEEYESLFKKAESLLTGGGEAMPTADEFDRFLLRNRLRYSDASKLYELKCKLDGCLDSLPEDAVFNYLKKCFGKKKKLFLPEDYRKVFAMASKTLERKDGSKEIHPDGVIYETSKEWNDSIWLNLFKIYRQFPSPIQYVQRITDRLGNDMFKNDPLRLRILKQMLLNIDFSNTDIELGVLKEYNSDDPKAEEKLSKLSDSLFEERTPRKGSISPLSDIKALVKNYREALSRDDRVNSDMIFKCLSEESQTLHRKEGGPILLFLYDRLSSIRGAENVFDPNISTEKIRQIIRNEIFRCRDLYKSGFGTETVNGLKKRLDKATKKNNVFDTVSLLLKNADSLPAFPDLPLPWNKEEVNAELGRYSDILERKTKADKAHSLLLKARNSEWGTNAFEYILKHQNDRLEANGEFFRQCGTLPERLRPYFGEMTRAELICAVVSLPELQSSLNAELAQSNAKLTGYFEGFKSFVSAAELGLSINKALSKCNINYHNATRPSAKTNILDCCEYLASGCTAEVGHVLAKRSLYLYAFAFGMEYFPQGSEKSNPNTDVEKNLFVELYADNLVHFADSEAFAYAYEPSGVGINTKNYEECVYLYYLNRKDIAQRERYKTAYATVMEIRSMESSLPPRAKQANTRAYRFDLLPRLLKCEKKEELIQYICEEYDIRRKSKENSVLDINSTSRSVCEAYAEIMEKTKSAQMAEYGYSEEKYARIMGMKNNKNELFIASMITPWLSVRELEAALDPEMLKENVLNELETCDSSERSKILQPIINCMEGQRDANTADFTPEEISSALELMVKRFVHLVKACLYRLDKDNLPPVNKKDEAGDPAITRTKIIAAYFHYFCQNNLDTEKTLSQVYDYVTEYTNKYLEKAGLQKMSPKNLFDILTVVFTYGYINYAIV